MKILKEKENVPKNEVKVQEIESKFLTKKQNIFVVSLIILAVFIAISIYWLYQNTGNLTLEQIIFHLKVPTKGTNIDMVWDYVWWTLLRILLITVIISGILYMYEKKSKLKKSEMQRVLYFLSKVTLIASIITVLYVIDVWGFTKNQITASQLIEIEYVDSSKVAIEFPEQKQNLIYIYLESMENTFSSTENGGMYQEDRMPELSQLAKENLNFSNTENIGGALNLQGTGWTIAAMVSQTSGVPLKISIGQNDYGNHETFLPGVYTLGEVLEKNGYKNYLLLGSESEFGGRKSYFESHGNYKIWDYISAVEEKRMTKEEKVWWGYDDSDLFAYAKEQLTEISKKDEPFNYTMLTVDTHFTDGYLCENCEEHFEDQYSNVIRCSSQQVAEFVSWIKEQPFYENTTIIVTGDHLTMQASIEQDANEKKYGERSVYNAFINAKAEPVLTTNRTFFTIDMYPTTLAALGAKIEGNRLGLGTNLFSEEQTLAEKYGLQYVREELEKKSTFYNKYLIYANNKNQEN